jgi:hypothetical protein
MIDWCSLTQLLEFLIKIWTLISEEFGYNTKPIKHPIKKCIKNLLIILIW